MADGKANLIIVTLSVFVIISLVISIYGMYSMKMSLAEIHDRISVSLNKLGSDLEGMRKSIDELKPIRDHVETLKFEISSVSERIGGLEQKVGEIEKRASSLERRVEELGSPFPVTLVDVLGRTVMIPSEPKRIVSMAPSVTEILFSLNLGDRIVGVDQYSDYPPEVLKLREEGKVEVIGGFTTPSVEKIVALNPDLVIAVELQAKVVKTLESLGITVITVKSEAISDVYSSILTIGRATGRYETATALVNQLKGRIRSVWELVRDLDVKAKVVHLVWLNPIMAAGGRSYINDIISLAGGLNVFGNVDEGYPVVNPEALVENQPDVIIVSGHAYPGKSPEEIVDFVKSVPGWENIKAVRENKVYVLMEEAEDVLVRPGPRVALAVELMAKILYPELFGITSVPTVITSLNT